MRYHLGIGVPVDFKKAIALYQKAADGGHGGAQNNLAALYDLGTGVKVDRLRAHKLYLAAAEQGLAEAQFNVALNHAQGRIIPQDWASAKIWYEKAAAQGHMGALNNLGNLYLKGGRGVRVDLEQARKYYAMPAESGVAYSQLGMAIAYLQEKRTAEAIPWLKRLAYSGYPVGQYFLGMAYFEDGDSPKDPAEALKWAERAVDSSQKTLPELLPEAKALVEHILSYTATKTKIDDDFRKARISADAGDANGQEMLGNYYRDGIGVLRDVNEAIRWYRLAADQKNGNAAYALGEFYARGVEVPLNMAKAANFYRIAAEQGHAKGQWKLGLCFRDATGVDEDLKEARKWFALAVKQEPNDFDFKNSFVEVDRRLNRSPAEEAYRNAEARLGLAISEKRSLEEPLRYMNEAVALGHPYAIVALANVYRRGVGLPQNTARADELIQKVETTTDPELLYTIGMGFISEHDESAPVDPSRAAPYFRRAALCGHHRAQNALGYYYMSAKDGEKNLAEATKWLTLSKRQGNDNARANLQKLNAIAAPSQLKQGTKQADGFVPIQ